MKRRYIAFDVDGTLLDALPIALETLRRTLLERTGRKYPIERLCCVMGLSNEDTFRVLELPYSEEFIAYWTALQRAEGERVQIFPGITETLEVLKGRGCTLGIVTSRCREEYEMDRPLFDRIERYFDYIVLSEMTKEHKPSPEPLLKFMELCAACPEETLYVGDTKWDMQCAMAAGAKGALALWGALDPNVEADFRLAEPKDILEIP